MSPVHLVTASAGAGGRVRCCTFHYLSCTENKTKSAIFISLCWFDRLLVELCKLYSGQFYIKTWLLYLFVFKINTHNYLRKLNLSCMMYQIMILKLKLSTTTKISICCLNLYDCVMKFILKCMIQKENLVDA